MKDLIPGGLADKMSDKDFPKKQLHKGEKVESEHTSSKEIAKEIARDHLAEDEKYYDKLEKMEKSALIGVLSPDFISGFDKMRPGRVGTVRHNFRKKDVYERGTYDEDTGKVTRSSGKFFTMNPTGDGYTTINDFSDRTNKQLAGNKDFAKAISDRNALWEPIEKSAFWDGFEKSAGAITEVLKRIKMNKASVRKTLASEIKNTRKGLKVKPDTSDNYVIHKSRPFGTPSVAKQLDKDIHIKLENRGLPKSVSGTIKKQTGTKPLSSSYDTYSTRLAPKEEYKKLK